MTILDYLDLPKTDPGYLKKADIAKLLKDMYNIEYTPTQIKKMKRDDLADELRKNMKSEDKSVKKPTKPKGKIKSAFYKMFNKFF